MKKYLYYAAIAVFALLVLPTIASALTPEQRSLFRNSGIIFYDPGATNCLTSSGYGSAYVAGSTAAEKIWTGLVSVGFTEEQAAGALGNIAHEGLLNPAQWEQPYSDIFDYYNNSGGVNGSGGGFGLIQWSGSRRTHILSELPADLKAYADGEDYGKRNYVHGDKFIDLAGDDAANAFFGWQIEYLYREMSDPSHPKHSSLYKKVFEQTTVESATWAFLTHVEAPCGIRDSSGKCIESILPSTTIERAKQLKPERFADAQKYYEEFAGRSVTSLGSSIDPTGSQRMATIIGDSITVASNDEIATRLPKANIEAMDGRPFSAAFSIISNRPEELGDTVIIALGTNSAYLTFSDVDSLISLIGRRRNIIFVTNYTSTGLDLYGNPLDFSNNNSLFWQAAAAHDHVSVVDWAAAAAADTDRYIMPDGIHPTADGQVLFAALIIEGILDVASGASRSDNCISIGGGSIAQTAISLAWPDKDHYNVVKPEFLAAAQALNRGTRSYCPGYRAETGRGWPDEGVGSPELDFAQDCGIFVSVVMHASGVDTNFPHGGTSNMGPYMANRPDLYMPVDNLGNTSNLQPGDIFVYNSGGGPGNGHTFIYLGDQPGINGNIAEASLCQHTGHIDTLPAVSASGQYLGGSSSTPYSIFRYIGGGGDVGNNFTGAIGEALERFEASKGVRAGIAVAPTNGDASSVTSWGSWPGGRAWSTIKVPLAIAASNHSGGTLSGSGYPYGACSAASSVNSAIASAINSSNNCSAWNLWQYLGGNSSTAANAVMNTLKAGKDTSTVVPSSPTGGGLTSGQANWSIANQALFAANIASVPDHHYTFSQMGTHSGGDNSGLYTVFPGSRTKSGNSGASATATDTITRQFGIIAIGGGQCSAVALGVNGGSGSNFDWLTELAGIVKNNLSSLPSGPCPEGM